MLLDKIHGSLGRLHKIWVWKFYVKVTFEKDSVTRLNQGATCILLSLHVFGDNLTLT